jgi:hypothetical protein
MRLKALLLGSATAIAVAGGAQAADLSVAEPVDYVKVCDAFGTGYWYIPGTDTCLKIWGFVDFKVGYDQKANDGEDHYDFYTGAYVNFSAKSMTDWGPLEGFLAFYMEHGGNNPFIGGTGVYMDEAYISLGPLMAGYTNSGFNQQLPWMQEDSAASGWFQPEFKTNLVRLNWAVNGFGLLIELDEPGYGYDQFDIYGDPIGFADFNNASAMPDVIAALTASTSLLDGKVSFVWSDYSGGWAASAGVVIKLDSLSSGSKLLLKAAYGDDAPYYVLGYSKNYNGNYIAPFSVGTAWSAMANLLYYFAPNFNISALVNYGHWENFTDHDQWQAAFNIGYSPVPNLWINPEVRWKSSISNLGGSAAQSDWQFVIRARRTFF